MNYSFIWKQQRNEGTASNSSIVAGNYRADGFAQSETVVQHSFGNYNMAKVTFSPWPYILPFPSLGINLAK